ncbi:MAG: hypothetical protein V7K21_28255 [Nostoc sp.]
MSGIYTADFNLWIEQAAQLLRSHQMKVLVNIFIEQPAFTIYTVKLSVTL